MSTTEWIKAKVTVTTVYSVECHRSALKAAQQTIKKRLPDSSCSAGASGGYNLYRIYTKLVKTEIHNDEQ